MVKKNVLTNLDNKFKMKLEGLFKRTIVKKTIPKKKKKTRKFKLKKLDESEISKIQDEIELIENKKDIINKTNIEPISDIKELNVVKINNKDVEKMNDKSEELIKSEPLKVESDIKSKENSKIISNREDLILTKLLELNNELINIEILRLKERKEWFHIKYILKYVLLIYVGYKIMF